MIFDCFQILGKDDDRSMGLRNAVEIVTAFAWSRWSMAAEIWSKMGVEVSEYWLIVCRIPFR